MNEADERFVRKVSYMVAAIGLTCYVIGFAFGYLVGGL